MRTTDTTPIRDPRNAVGLMTDVLSLALAGPKWAPYVAADGDGAALCVKLGREFSKMPRHFTNGYKRRGGSSELYQRLKAAQELLPADPDWRMRDNGRRETYNTVHSLGSRIYGIALDALEDERRWEKFITETKIPAHPWTNTPASIAPPEWLKAWHDFVSSAQRLGVDLGEISTIECGWRFRDLTDRSHRGRNVRAAWEAAWLSGNYKFATQLISEVLG